MPAYRFWDVHDLQIRLVSQIVDFCPEHRNTTPSLDITQFLPSINPSSTRVLSIGGKWVKQDNLLSLVVIGSVTINVDSSSEISCSGSVSGSSRDEKEEKFSIVDC